MNRFIPRYEVTFPHFQQEWPQQAHELYERRRFVGFTTARQSKRFRCRFRLAWRGIHNIDTDTIKPFMKEVRT